MDENKFLFFAGRKDDRINIGGVSVYLNDISNALKSLSYVIDIAVVGISDDYFGMVPAVALVIDSQNEEICNLDEKRIQRKVMAFSARKLAPYQLPRRIKFYKSLPLLSNGKLDRQSIIYHLQIDES